MRIAVLGAGMVGRAIALDLAKDYNVTSFDKYPSHLSLLSGKNKNIHTVEKDLSDYAAYPTLLAEYDLVVTAVPGFMGYKTLEAVILAGKNVADISFFPEDALGLHQLAVEKNVTAITDCGVAPGMSNFILGYYNSIYTIKSFEFYVGGLPLKPEEPFKYKAPFSPVDVIEEYIRPARMMENGRIITKPALTNREMISFEKAGTLEAFNTDGLRSLLYTMGHIPDMKEKTLRYPGHIDIIVALQKAGFFEEKEITIKGEKYIPLNFTSALLIKEWKLEDDEPEFTVMRTIIHTTDEIIQYDLYDEYDELSRTSSMARTTGYTCTAAANMIIKGLFNKQGVFPPELVGNNKNCFEFLLNYLRERNVIWKFSKRSID